MSPEVSSANMDPSVDESKFLTGISLLLGQRQQVLHSASASQRKLWQRAAPFLTSRANWAFSRSTCRDFMACSMLLSWPFVWLKFTMMLSRFFSACASRFSRSCASHVPSSQSLDIVLSPACLCDWAAVLPLLEKIRLIVVQCVVSGSEQASDHMDILVNTWTYAKMGTRGT